MPVAGFRPEDGSAWTAGGSCIANADILRGGSWGFPPEDVRSAFRFGAATDRRSASDGFRIGRTLAP
jgi:formylglycine-generating enzyme required for sulfatase activity